VRIVPAAVLLVLTVPAVAGPGAAPTALPRVSTMPALVQRVREAQVRFDALVERAKQDPRMGEIEAYVAYKDDDFASGKRSVRVTNLIAIVADDEAPLALRKKAKDAITGTNARTMDPDLAYTGTGHSKRAAFSTAKVVPLLGAKTGEGGAVDETARRFAAEILDSLWHYATKATAAFDPKTPATWRPAQDDWRKYLLTK
jgi:hypothetical protein